MDAVQGIALSVAREGDETVIYARGQLDFATKSELTKTIEAARHDATAVCALDFEMVTFIDSETLKSLLFLHRALAQSGKVLYIRKCSAQVMRTITLLGLDQSFGCGYSDIESAQNA